MSEPIKDKEDIRQWWADNPMTYGEVHGETSFATPEGEKTESALGTRAFFDNVDETFYGRNVHLHDASGRFGKIFPYERYRGKVVIEVGCGLGTMAMNWAEHGAVVHALDLNPVAVAQTQQRFRQRNLPVRAMQVDSNDLPFAAQAVDYAYSWGVLHHSPNLERSIAELFRVLKSGGGFGVMLYHRESMLFGYTTRFFEGYLHGESRFLNELELASRYGDGDRKEGNPHTWPVTKAEMKALFSRWSGDLSIQTMGNDLDYLLEQIMPHPKLARLVPALVLKPWARRLGWHLWMSGTKRT
jgi:ubiquinone/menaquinone biosynthesis C-methylase UbiE